MKQYDFIILGAGAAGLSLLLRLLDDPRNSNRKYLLAERAPKKQNDRTWCFWENKKGYFEAIVHKRWDELRFESDGFSSSFNIAPYSYKMIRGIDFYDHCFKIIGNHKNVEVLYGEISTGQVNQELIINIGNETILGGKAIVFNSIYEPRVSSSSQQINLLQHFKGWLIETTKPVFNDKLATLMDFRVHQEHGTSFAYLLPISNRLALVEYTLFTENLLSAETYALELRNYIDEFLSLDDYQVKEEEFGVIPMTTAKFPFYASGMYHIGTAGGQTKPSTGYTFSFIQKQMQAIADCLRLGQPLSGLKTTPSRFHFYDRVLLQVLQQGKPSGREVFTRLFQSNSPQSIFGFLDNESSPAEELAIIKSLPFFPFLKAAGKQWKQ